MCRTSIYEARNNFSVLVKAAEEGEVVELTRYDKPIAVIISYTEYENLVDNKPSLLSIMDEIKLNDLPKTEGYTTTSMKQQLVL